MGDKSKRVRENPSPTMVIHVERIRLEELGDDKDANILTVPGLKECTWQLEEAILA